MTTVTLSQQALDELLTQLRAEIKLMVQEEVREALQEQETPRQNKKPRPPLDIPALEIYPFPEHLNRLRREDIYGDEGR